ncbi:RidA family protein [Candidatus Tisiphia endosymbiont of Temnostethus pusillus]|uniref:RidA family protein n=1 Tax=Candidatus Tisiphia endosymbiont of Temnostethus pusillus TaxID=3139335 RepID=UPI0035C8F323
MIEKIEITTSKAPQPRGKYSQAIKVNNVVFLSGQLPIDIKTNILVKDNYEQAFIKCFENISEVCMAAGGTLNKIVKLNVFLTHQDSSYYLDKVIPRFFNPPYPARSRVFVTSLSKGAQIEIEAIMIL